MNKFTKISLVAIFSIFLSACDKPANTEQAKTAEVAKTTEMAKATETQGAEDFNKLLAWKASQEAVLNQSQNDIQQGIASKDSAKIEKGFKEFETKVESVLTSLDSLEIKNADVQAFKAKTKESLVLSSELIKTWVKASAEPTAEIQKVIQEKAKALIELGADLQQTQLELQKKFAPTQSAQPTK